MSIVLVSMGWNYYCISRVCSSLAMYISEVEVYFIYDFKLGVRVSQTLCYCLSQKTAEVLHIQERLFSKNILHMQFEEQLTSYFKSQNLWQTNCFMCCMPGV